jgi:hypothetical protein
MRTLLALLGLFAFVGSQEAFDTDDPLDADFRTGVEVGQKVPAFRGADFNGRIWDFESIRGPRGAVLHFYRSADW